MLKELERFDYDIVTGLPRWRWAKDPLGLMRFWPIKPIRRKPDHIIGQKSEPYMLRWWLIPRNKFFNIYLHKFLRSDSDVPHDHPWPSLSIALKGMAFEEHRIGSDDDGRAINERRLLLPGTICVRSSEWQHRLVIWKTWEPFWTIFITGPVIRGWGFWCDEGRRFVPWREFVDAEDKGNVGRGCAEN